MFTDVDCRVFCQEQTHKGEAETLQGLFRYTLLVMLQREQRSSADVLPAADLPQQRSLFAICQAFCVLLPVFRHGNARLGALRASLHASNVYA